jgi:PPIC-type PPIASE domain
VELAHLVPAPVSATAPRTLRLLARFFAAGFALFVLRLVLFPPEEPLRPMVVEVAEGASEPEISAAVDESILVDLAVRAGWPRSDAVVRERMLKSLAVVEDVESNPGAAVERAILMGLPERDLIARARLAASARRALEHAGPLPEITDDEIVAHVRANDGRFRTAARVRFGQLFLSADARGARLAEDAASLAERLETASPADLASLRALADPWPWTPEGTSISEARLDALVGEGFGEAVARAPIARWTGPIRSSFGLHFVRLDAREEGRLPEPHEVRARVEEEIRADRRAARYASALRRLRARYAVSLERRP